MFSWELSSLTAHVPNFGFLTGYRELSGLVRCVYWIEIKTDYSEVDVLFYLDTQSKKKNATTPYRMVSYRYQKFEKN